MDILTLISAAIMAAGLDPAVVWSVTATILQVLLAGHGVALLIVNLTPTPADNAILAKVYPWIEWLAGLVSKRTKDYPGETALRKSVFDDLKFGPGK